MVHVSWAVTCLAREVRVLQEIDVSWGVVSWGVVCLGEWSVLGVVCLVSEWCIVLYLYIYIPLLAVHTNQKRFQCERPREKRTVCLEREWCVLGSGVSCKGGVCLMSRVFSGVLCRVLIPTWLRLPYLLCCKG